MHHALIPCLRYRDAPAAIAFLGDAFGFERHVVYLDDDDPAIVHHAEMTLHGSMIMLGSAANASAATQLYGWKTPAEAGAVTMSIYATVDDPDAHAARARAAGARIIREPCDNQGYPGRGYDAEDCEGNVWSFGSYDPWAAAG
jgi:uncharacterized glyoxalase superfamily protein PhnB